jgi:general secretion pathway protein L
MRILGIDLGSSSVKIVEVDSAFGRYDIHDYHEQAVNPEQEPAAIASEMIKKLSKVPDRIVVSLNSTQVTFRNLQLPTRDKKAIQAGVGFELEDELPFSSESSAYDYSVIAQSKQGSTIHVAATLKRYIAESVSRWQEFSIDPDIITTDTWAYRSLMNRVLGVGQVQLTGPTLLVQIGHQKTTFYLHSNGAPSFLREIDWGGRDLTIALSQHFQIPVDQAESMKVDRGAILLDEARNGAASEQKEFSECVEKELQNFLVELRQIELMTKNVTKASVSSIYLAGGTALLQGLGTWLEKNVHIPVKPLLALSSSTPSGVTYSEQTDAKFILAASLALSIVGSDRALNINFRKGEFGKEGKTRDLNLQAFKKPLIAVGVVAASLFLSLMIESTVYRSRLASTDTQLEKSVRSFFGQMSNSALRTYMANTTTLRNSINKELNKQRELARLLGPNPKSPLEFLNGLSSTITRDVVVDMTQFQAGTPSGESYVSGDQTQSASMTFLVANPQMAEKLASLVGSKMSQVQRGKLEETASPDPEDVNKKWKITFTGKPNEDSYAK